MAVRHANLFNSLINVGYQDQKYPSHTGNLNWDFSIPFPESFDQYLPGSLAFSLQPQSQGSTSSSSSGVPFLDANADHIDGMVFPEATSAFYLSNVLQQLSGPTPPSPAHRNMLSSAITAHTLNIMGASWKRGDRAAVGTNFMYIPLPSHTNPASESVANYTYMTDYLNLNRALMKINQPGLLSGAASVAGAGHSGTTTPDPHDVRPIETIRSVINSIYSRALDMEQTEPRLVAGGMASGGAFAMYYASLLLISHGSGVLQDREWLEKVEGFVRTLELFSRRWKIAGK